MRQYVPFQQRPLNKGGVWLNSSVGCGQVLSFASEVGGSRLSLISLRYSEFGLELLHMLNVCVFFISVIW